MTVRYLILLASLSCLILGAPSAAQQCPALDDRMCKVPDPSLLPPYAEPKRLKYGPKHWQDASFYGAGDRAIAPLVVVFGVGGKDGWTGWLRYRLNDAGYAVAFVRYGENVPKADGTVAAYAAAVAYLLSQADDLHIDRGRIALFGRGSDAAFAALLGTDPTLLEGVGVPFGSIRAVVGYGGAGFDLTARAARSQYLTQRYRRYVGSDPADYVRLSAVNHLAAPNAPAFLMLAEETDAEGRDESRAAVDSFARAGIDARFAILPAVHDGAKQTYFMLEPDGSGSELLPFLRSQLSGAAEPNAVSAG